MSYISQHRDIAVQRTEQGVISCHGKAFSRYTIGLMFHNPIYVIADLEIYEFFKSQGTEICNNAAHFVETNGCYYYQSKGNTENKQRHLQGQILVVAPSEDPIPSELWLRVRKKIMTNQSYQPARKAYHSWLAGKIKRGRCGYALPCKEKRINSRLWKKSVKIA